MNFRERRVVTGVVVGGAVIVAWAGMAFNDELIERWYLWKLDSPREEERQVAAEALGRLKSTRAIPRLTEILRSAAARAGAIWCDSDRIVTVVLTDAADKRLRTDVRSHYSFKALVEIGRPAVPALRRLTGDQNQSTRRVAALALSKIDPLDPSSAAVLRTTLGVFDSPAPGPRSTGREVGARKSTDAATGE